MYPHMENQQAFLHNRLDKQFPTSDHRLASDPTRQLSEPSPLKKMSLLERMTIEPSKTNCPPSSRDTEKTNSRSQELLRRLAPSSTTHQLSQNPKRKRRSTSMSKNSTPLTPTETPGIPLHDQKRRRGLTSPLARYSTKSPIELECGMISTTTPTTTMTNARGKNVKLRNPTWDGSTLTKRLHTPGTIVLDKLVNDSKSTTTTFPGQNSSSSSTVGPHQEFLLPNGNASSEEK